MQFFNSTTGQPLEKACFQFDYKGFSVSISNMFGRCEILAFNNTDKDITASSIPEVINKIDNLIK